MDIAPQPSHRQRIRCQDHGAKQLRRQLDIPALIVLLDDLTAALTEVRGCNIFQLPVITLVLRTSSEAGGLHTLVVVEAVASHPEQHAIGLHGVDVHIFLPLAMPQATLGALCFAAALGHGATGLSLIFAVRRQVLANQHADQHQHQHRLHHRPDNPPDRYTRRTHDGQLAVTGQRAQPDQTANQGGHRQHFINSPRRRQQYIPQGIQQAVVALDVPKLIDKGKQQCQTDDDA